MFHIVIIIIPHTFVQILCPNPIIINLFLLTQVVATIFSRTINDLLSAASITCSTLQKFIYYRSIGIFFPYFHTKFFVINLISTSIVLTGGFVLVLMRCLLRKKSNVTSLARDTFSGNCLCQGIKTSLNK